MTEVLTNTMSIWHCTADPTFFGVFEEKEVWVFGGQRYLRILNLIFVQTFSFLIEDPLKSSQSLKE